MEYLTIGVVAFTAALMTLFSGFGLGTLLLPAFALFLPLPLAVIATAIVHGANNLLKVGLLFRSINYQVLFQFGFTAIFSAFVGAVVLVKLAQSELVIQWTFLPWDLNTTLLKLFLGGLILVFAAVELSGLKKSYQFDVKWLPFGGIISGFFGGLSGHQGAFRSMFLLRVGLEPKPFIATQSVIALAVDLVRLLVYLWLSVLLVEHSDSRVDVSNVPVSDNYVANNPIITESLDLLLLICGIFAAFSGTLIGRKFLEKTTMTSIRWLTSILLFTIGLGLMSGLI